MPKVQRLRKGWEFDEIFRTGTRINGELVRILYLRNGGDCIKFGCAVGKRQGKAHVRTRGRRILREAFRALSGRMLSGIKIVLTLQDKGLSSKSTDIQPELERLLIRRRLLVKNS
ncbi:MAG: ribonuclease P protein component [Synergistaceae bacterium]|nr:ribonuclease P protein component [Synergistaceae bacterium]